MREREDTRWKWVRSYFTSFLPSSLTCLPLSVVVDVSELLFVDL